VLEGGEFFGLECGLLMENGQLNFAFFAEVLEFFAEFLERLIHLFKLILRDFGHFVENRSYFLRNFPVWCLHEFFKVYILDLLD